MMLTLLSFVFPPFYRLSENPSMSASLSGCPPRGNILPSQPVTSTRRQTFWSSWRLTELRSLTDENRTERFVVRNVCFAPDGSSFKINFSSNN